MQYICKFGQTHAKRHLRLTGNVEKSDEKQETKSQMSGINTLNFGLTEEGLKMHVSARFTHI